MHSSGLKFGLFSCFFVIAFFIVSKYNSTVCSSLLVFESFIIFSTIGTAINEIIASITITANNSINVNLSS